jgi:hypothetical protein
MLADSLQCRCGWRLVDVTNVCPIYSPLLTVRRSTAASTNSMDIFENPVDGADDYTPSEY